MPSRVVIGNLNVEWAVPICRPFKADSPLLVDADAELSLAIAAQGFKTIARQPHQIVPVYCSFQQIQSPFGLILECLKFPDPLARGKASGASIAIFGFTLQRFRIAHTLIDDDRFDAIRQAS